MCHSELITKAFAAFATEANTIPSVTLRGGNAIDDCKEPAPFDQSLDEISDSYFEEHIYGIYHLDASSWRHYLPYLIQYSIGHVNQGALVVDAFLNSLRPPDREPPRLASLNPEQVAIVTAFLDTLAFDEHSAHTELACQVLEEWWVPDALYRGQAA